MLVSGCAVAGGPRVSSGLRGGPPVGSARCARATVSASVLCHASQDDMHSASNTREALMERRFLMSVAVAGLAGAVVPRARAEAETAEAGGAAAEVDKIYFGNGCFWGRQKDYVDVELSMGRDPKTLSATVGYAGGPYTSSDGRVCYYYAPPETEYERLGHAEVVGVELRGTTEERQAQLQEYSKVYFKQFRKTPFGMQRQDPQDEGPGYRNVIGIPGGMDSPLMSIIKEQNVNNMEMMPGKGNLFDRSGRASEDDRVNRVYVMDSTKLGFHQAEMYHQFHNGLGKEFPKWYTKEMKVAAKEAGIIQETGCPERPFGIQMSPF